jgi:transposase
MFKTARPATAIQTNLGAIFISLELSRSTWLITSLLPGNSGKMSKHNVKASDIAGLFDLFSKLRERCRARTGHDYPIISIQEAGLDGFWIHRLLQGNGIESHVVDAASIAAPRRSKRAKTDRIDGEALVRVLMAHKRDEPRVCSMVRAPSPEEEDRRRIGRERRQLTTERVSHSNRIRGLLFSQGITDYNPVLRNRRSRLEELRTGDGRALPPQLKAQICRELDRLELVLAQLKAIEQERDALLTAQAAAAQSSPVAMLLDVRGIGAEFANAL